MSLGRRIKEQRKKACMSQEKVAELVGVSRQAVTKWEGDLSAPSTANLFALAEILGTTVDLLLDTEGDETKRSSSSQTYYLYKMEEEKKAAELREKREKNIRAALIAAICYLGLFAVGLIITGGLGERGALFKWIPHYYPLLFAAVISIISALLGKRRLSLVTFVANILGIIFGTLLGSGYTGSENSMSYYGWSVWGGIFLVSFTAGIIWEIFLSRKGKRNQKKLWLLSGIALTVVILFSVFIINSVPKYAQPEYEVGSYESLFREFSDEMEYILPLEDQLPGEATSFKVYLKSRFSDEKIGYLVDLAPQAEMYDNCTITSLLVNSHPGSSIEIQSDLEYKGTAIQVSEYEVKFQLGECQYFIQFNPLSDEFVQEVVYLATAIIDLG